MAKNTRHDCSECFWGDQCPQDKVCEDFYDMSDELDDTYVDEIIESERREFCKDWFAQMNEWYDE